MEKIADILKPDYEQRMNIQMTPWDQSDVVKMEDLYTRLTIEKQEKKPHGVEKENISDDNETNMEYKRLLAEETQHTKKILVKGDPGIGKSTLVRKIAWDWAKGIFESFTLLLVIVLKLVSPMDSLEEMIMQQNPILEGSNVSSKTLKGILDCHGDQCLILLDGYDEMPQNIIAIENFLQKRIHPKCNAVLTSRPNSVASIRSECFMTVASVEGFSKEKAKEYIEKILNDKHNVDAVMRYSESNEIEDMWRYPVLIMFLCLLVNNGKIDIVHEKLSLNDLYIRLHNFLYERYIEKAEIPFNEEEKENSLLKLGKIALEGIINQKHGFQKSFVTREVGKEIFKYGILIEDTDTRKLAREDVSVFFPHKTIQEFLAAKYLVTEVHEGHSVLTKLIGKQKREFVLDNLMLFLFALEHSISLPPPKRKFLSWSSKVSDQLKEYIYNALKDCLTINLKSIALSGQASNILIEQIARCTSVANLKIEGIRFGDSLATLLQQMSSLKTLRFTDCSYVKPAKQQAKHRVFKNVRNMAVTNRFKKDQNTDLIDTLLYFQYETLTKLDFSYCNLQGHILKSLSNANQHDNLPKLTYLYLNNNLGISGSLFNLFQTVWNCLETFHAYNCNLPGKQVYEMMRASNTCFPKWKDIKLFGDHSAHTDFLTLLKEVPTKFILQYLPLPERKEIWPLFLKAYQAECRVLDLTNCDLHSNDLMLLSKANASDKLCVVELILQNNRNISGHLHMLFYETSPWKSLELLDCSFCDLQASDLLSLSKASSASYLPVLKHPRFGYNWLLHDRLLNTSSTVLDFKCWDLPAAQEASREIWQLWPWPENVLGKSGPQSPTRAPPDSQKGLLGNDLIALSTVNASGFMHVTKLVLTNNRNISGNLYKLFHEKTPWKSLEMLDCSDCDLQASDLISLSQAYVAGHLPVLKHPELGLKSKLDGIDEDLLSDHKPHWSEMTVLNLRNWDLQADDLIALSRGNASGLIHVTKLVLTKISDNLGQLFHDKTPWKSLEMLDCSDCYLQASDLISLSEANAAGYIPVLKHLGLRDNKHVGGHLMKLFHGKTPWKLLEMLDCSSCDLQASDLISLSETNAAGYLPSLKQLGLGDNIGLEVHLMKLFHEKTPWKCLEMLDCSGCDLQASDLISLSETNAAGYLPVLKHPASGYDWTLNRHSKLNTSLTVLDLRCRHLQADDLIALSKGNASGFMHVTKLVLTVNRMISQHLAQLFHEKTPWKSLEMLDCHSCDLQASDLRSLSEANAAGYLPVLRHIDLKENLGLQGHLHELLHTQSTWDSLEILVRSGFPESDCEFLFHALQDGRLPKLNTVKYASYFSKVSEELKVKIQKHVKLEQYY